MYLTNNRIWIVLLMMIFLFISSCQTEEVTSTIDIHETQNLKDTPTTSQGVSKGPTEVQSSGSKQPDYFATQTFTVTYAPDVTITPTSTLIPTLAPTEAQVFLRELIATNGDCRFPCWFGITPGETSFENALAFFRKFTKVEVDEKSKLIVYFDLEKIVGKDKWLTAELFVEENVINEIVLFQNYFNKELITGLHAPSQILIYIIESPSNDLPDRFDLSFFYPIEGILVNYTNDIILPEPTESIEICLEDLNPNFVTILLWNNAIDRTFNEAAGTYILGPGPYKRKYYPIKEVTDVSDLQNFFEKYIDPDKKACLVAQPTQWP